MQPNVLDPQFYVDPWPAYRWLRDEAPAYRDPVQGVWAVSRHADVIAVEKHTARYTSVPGSRPRIDQSADSSMINQDDPVHQRQRNLVARRFTPRAVRQHEDDVRAVVDELIDAFVDEGRCEVVEEFASRLPAIVIGEKLGYPRELWPKVRLWSEVTMHEAGQTPANGDMSTYQSPKSGEVMLEWAGITLDLIAQRRAEPRDDLLSVWTHAEREGQGRPWTDQEILEECILVLDGGAETTRTVIAAIVRELALRPDARRLLAERPELLSSTAVEEFIRWVTPIVNMRRTATEDHDLHGETIHEGDEVLLLYGAANRDDRVFHDPEAFDVTRAHNHHVAFGFGTHFCLGASLARLELRVAFEQLLRRIPDWELAADHEPTVVPATFTRAYDRVEIQFPRRSTRP